MEKELDDTGLQNIFLIGLKGYSLDYLAFANNFESVKPAKILQQIAAKPA